MENTLTYPITGAFTSKRGTVWNYRIFSDNTVEQWHSTIVRKIGGDRQGHDVFSPQVTKECKEVIFRKYGIIVN